MGREQEGYFRPPFCGGLIARHEQRQVAPGRTAAGTVLRWLLISSRASARRRREPRLAGSPLAATVLLGCKMNGHGSEVPQLSVLCHVQRGRPCFPPEGAKEHLLPTLVCHIKRGEKKHRRSVVSFLYSYGNF